MDKNNANKNCNKNSKIFLDVILVIDLKFQAKKKNSGLAFLHYFFAFTGNHFNSTRFFRTKKPYLGL